MMRYLGKSTKYYGLHSATPDADEDNGLKPAPCIFTFMTILDSEWHYEMWLQKMSWEEKQEVRNFDWEAHSNCDVEPCIEQVGGKTNWCKDFPRINDKDGNPLE